MSLVTFSVRRPVFISMLSCIVLVLGGVALRSLPVDLMPDITFPAISVTTEYDDASPEEVEELISKPLEEALSAVSGVKEIRSVSSEGISTVTVDFNWGVNLDGATSDVRDRIDRTISRLPDGVDRPMVRKFDSANMPIMRIGVGTQMDLLQARQLLEDQIQYRFERIEGVAALSIFGGRQREIQVRFDPEKARLLGTTLDAVLDKIREGNVTTPAGNLREGRMEIRIRTPGTYNSLRELEDVVIDTGKDGELIRLRDVAEVVDTYEKVTRFVRVNRKPGIMLGIYRQSGANTVSVADAVVKEIERVNEEYRQQIELQPIINNAQYIRQAITSVADSAINGGLLAILLLLFFLRNIGSTLVISLSIPMSIIATFVVVYFCGYTLNVMTLGGLALGIGMLVDNSIVVLENITRLRDEGMSAEKAAIQGADEVAAAIVASTLTTVAVFLPLLFVKGVAGVMFREFSMVVAFSLACSLLAAISLVPMLAARMLRKNPEPTAKRRVVGRFLDSIGAVQVALESGYGSVLDTVLRRRWIFITGSILLVAASLLLIPLIGSEFMPKADEGIVRVYVETAVGTSPEVVDETVRTMEGIIYEDVKPELFGWTAASGNSSWSGQGGHKGDFNIRLHSRLARKRSSERIATDLAQKLKHIPGAVVRTRSGQGMFSRMAGGSGEAINVDLRGHDFDVSGDLARRMIDMATQVQGVTDAKLSRDLGVPEERIVIDREKAADLRISVRRIADTLRTVLAGSSAGEFREEGDEYTILVKVRDAENLTMEQLLSQTVLNDRNEPVALRNLVTYNRVSGPVSIERKNKERVLSVQVNIAERDMGAVIADLQREYRKIPMPAGFNIVFSGDWEDQQDANRELGMAFLLALFLVYMVMACQFESLRDPFVVMLSVPLAAFGVMVMLFLSGTTFNVQTFIGCIMLAGIVVNNAILLVDTANLLRNRDGMPLELAIREAGRRRLRPILMTTLTTILGLVPLALGWGDGGETQAPMARAVIGGLTSSTFITLFFIPAVYYVLENFFRKDKQVIAQDR